MRGVVKMLPLYEDPGFTFRFAEARNNGMRHKLSDMVRQRRAYPRPGIDDRMYSKV
jgi:hypothetical protein